MAAKVVDAGGEADGEGLMSGDFVGPVGSSEADGSEAASVLTERQGEMSAPFTDLFGRFGEFDVRGGEDRAGVFAAKRSQAIEFADGLEGEVCKADFGIDDEFEIAFVDLVVLAGVGVEGFAQVPNAVA